MCGREREKKKKQKELREIDSGWLGREGNKPTIVGQSTWRTRHERRQKRCCGCQSKSAKEEQDNTERMIIRRKQTFAAHPTIEERKTVIDGHGPIK
jgi:hypothetical protein